MMSDSWMQQGHFVLCMLVVLLCSVTTIAQRELDSGPADKMLDVGLVNVGSSWALPLTVGGKEINLIADTGNNQFTILDLNYTSLLVQGVPTIPMTLQTHIGFPQPGAQPDKFIPLIDGDGKLVDNFPCLSLLEDGTDVVYLNRYNRAGFFSCYGATAEIVAVGSGGEQTVMTAENLTISNQFATSHSAPLKLHDWGLLSQGNVGMSFSSREYNASIFSQMVYETSKTKAATPEGDKSGVFGLDFNAAVAASSMQFGGVKPLYAQSTKWARQGLNRPQYHNVMIKNFKTCNARENLFGFALGLNSYPVMVDTGQVCLALPGEMYDGFVGWLDDKEYASAAELPALSFQVDDGMAGSVGPAPAPNDLMYIPAGNLLVKPDMLDGERDGPKVVVAGVHWKLCLLRNANIMSPEKDGSYSANPSPIIFGSLALQAVYFAADFHDTAVGMASKLTPVQVAAMYATTRCKAKAACIGQQLYDRWNNSCMSPYCSNYFFAMMDEASQMCYNRLDLYNAGLAIIILCVIFEIYSFFVLQYSGLQVMGVDIDSSSFRYARTMNTKVDIVSFHVGKWMSHATDFLIKLLEPWFASGETPQQ